MPSDKMVPAGQIPHSIVQEEECIDKDGWYLEFDEMMLNYCYCCCYYYCCSIHKIGETPI